MRFSPVQIFRSNHPVIRFLGSVNLAVVVLIAIAVACVAGTLIPQAGGGGGRPVQIYAAYVEKYGEPLHRIFSTLSLYRLYSSWWFSTLLVLLAVNMIVCALARLRWKWTQLGFQITHLSIVFLVAGVVAGLNGREGKMRVFEGEQSGALYLTARSQVARSLEEARQLERETTAEQDQPHVHLGFAIHLDDFELRRYAQPLDSIFVRSLPQGRVRSYNIAFQKKISRAAGEPWDIEVVEFAPEENEEKSAALSVRVRVRNRESGQSEEIEVAKGEIITRGNLQLVFEREYPIDQFISRVRVIENGRTVREKVIELNAPLKHRGYIFYQASYDLEAAEASRYTVLLVKRDPGTWFVYIGFGLLTLGLVVVFYVNPWLRRATREQQS